MIRFFHVTKRYALSRDPALKDVSFSLAKGEFAFLTGPSGAGKSTLLKLIFRGERADDGQVYVNGDNVNLFDSRQVALLRRQVGVVFQDFRLLPDRTVGENVSLALAVAGAPEGECRRRTEAALKEVGLLSMKDHMPLELSGGEQQRVAIARAIVGDPAVILADEPTGNLDPALAVEIMGLLKGLSIGGATVLVATHDLEIQRRFPSRTLHLDGGVMCSPSE